MSQPKLFIRPPPHKTFVQGYPSIPSSPQLDRPSPHLSGSVELRLGQKQINASYLKIELIKTETIPCAKVLPSSNAINRLEQIINQKPVVLWSPPPNNNNTNLDGRINPTDIKKPFKHHTSALSLSITAKAKHHKDHPITFSLQDSPNLESSSNNDIESEQDNQSPSNQTAGSTAWAPLESGDYDFKIDLPLDLPPSLTIHQKTGIGISYTLRAELCSRPRTTAGSSTRPTSWFKRTQSPIIITACTSIEIIRHDLHSTWPIYSPLPSEVSNVEDRGLSMEVVRKKVAMGPGDEINSRIKLQSQASHPIKVNRFEINLTEVLTFYPNGKALASSTSQEQPASTIAMSASNHLSSSKKNKIEGSSDLKRSTVVNVHAKVEQTLSNQTPLSFDVRGIFPEDHSRVTINTAQHLSIHYLMRIRVVLEPTGNYFDKKKFPNELIISDLPFTIGDRDQVQSKAIMEEIGPVTTLCPSIASSPTKNITPLIAPLTVDSTVAQDAFPHRDRHSNSPSPPSGGSSARPPAPRHRHSTGTTLPSATSKVQSQSTPTPALPSTLATPELHPVPQSIITTHQNGPRPYLFRPSNPRHSINHDTLLLQLTSPPSRPYSHYTFRRGADPDFDDQDRPETRPVDVMSSLRKTWAFQSIPAATANPADLGLEQSRSHASLRSTSQPPPASFNLLNNPSVHLSNARVAPPDATVPSSLFTENNVQYSNHSHHQSENDEKALFNRAKAEAAHVQSLIVQSPSPPHSISSNGSTWMPTHHHLQAFSASSSSYAATGSVSVLHRPTSLGPFPRHCIQPAVSANATDFASSALSASSSGANVSRSATTSYVNVEQEKRALESSLRSFSPSRDAHHGPSHLLDLSLAQQQPYPHEQEGEDREDFRSAVTQSTFLPMYHAPPDNDYDDAGDQDEDRGQAISPTLCQTPLSERIADSLHARQNSLGGGGRSLDLSTPPAQSAANGGSFSPSACYPVSPRLLKDHEYSTSISGGGSIVAGSPTRFFGPASGSLSASTSVLRNESLDPRKDYGRELARQSSSRVPRPASPYTLSAGVLQREQSVSGNGSSSGLVVSGLPAHYVIGSSPSSSTDGHFGIDNNGLYKPSHPRVELVGRHYDTDVATRLSEKPVNSSTKTIARFPSPPPPPVNLSTRPSASSPTAAGVAGGVVKSTLPMPPVLIDPQREAYLKAVAQRDAYSKAPSDPSIVSALEEKKRLKIAWEQEDSKRLSGQINTSRLSRLESSTSTSSSTAHQTVLGGFGEASSDLSVGGMLGRSSDSIELINGNNHRGDQIQQQSEHQIRTMRRGRIDSSHNGVIGNHDEEGIIQNQEVLIMPSVRRGHTPQGNWFE